MTAKKKATKKSATTEPVQEPCIVFDVVEKYDDRIKQIRESLAAARKKLDIVDDELEKFIAQGVIAGDISSHKFEETQDKLLKFARSSFRSTHRGHYTCIDDDIKAIAHSSRAMIENIMAERKKKRVASRKAELKQRITKGSIVMVDPELTATDVPDIDTCFERVTFNEYNIETGYYRRPVPPEAFDVTATTYKVPVRQPYFSPVYDQKYGRVKLRKGEQVIVDDSSTSSTYVRVMASDPVRYFWLKKKGLIVNQN